MVVRRAAEQLLRDGDEDLVEVSGVAERSSPPLHSSGVGRAELSTPLSDSLVGNDDATLGKQVFDFTQTQAEAVVEPDRVADDLWRLAVAPIRRLVSVHVPSLPAAQPT
jgi:hypothetical protein